VELIPEYKTKAVKLEKRIQKDIVTWLKGDGFHVDVINKGMYGTNGIADIIACKNGRYIAIEVKRQGNTPTLLQERWLEDVQDVGGIAFVAYSIQDVIREFEKYNI